MKFSRLAFTGLIVLAIGLAGCAAQQAATPAGSSAATTQPSATPAGSSAATTQPSATQASAGTEILGAVSTVHTVASNPGVEAIAGMIPYGTAVVGGLVLATGLIGSYFGNKTGQQTGAVATLQSATNTETVEDAVAAAHVALASQPKGASVLSDVEAGALAVGKALIAGKASS